MGVSDCVVVVVFIIVVVFVIVMMSNKKKMKGGGRVRFGNPCYNDSQCTIPPYTICDTKNNICVDPDIRSRAPAPENVPYKSYYPPGEVTPKREQGLNYGKPVVFGRQSIRPGMNRGNIYRINGPYSVSVEWANGNKMNINPYELVNVPEGAAAAAAPPYPIGQVVTYVLDIPPYPSTKTARARIVTGPPHMLARTVEGVGPDLFHIVQDENGTWKELDDDGSRLYDSEDY